MMDVLELDDANEEIERRNAAGETNEAGDPLLQGRGHPTPHGHHQGISRYGFLPLGSLLPGDYKGFDGGRHQGQGRSLAWA